MKELKLNDGTIIKYKEALSEAEYITLIDLALDAYIEGLGKHTDDLELVPYNPIKATQAFNRGLLSLCIDEYDSEKYDFYFQNNVHNILIDDVNNALDAWVMVTDLIERSVSLPMVVNNFLNNVLNILDGKLPDGKSMEKLLNKFPKDFGDAINKYAEILKPTKEEFDEKLENGDYSDVEKKELTDKN